MSNDLIFYQFSRSKVERGDFSHFLSQYAPDKLPEGRRLRKKEGVIKDFIAGEDFTIFNDTVLTLLEAAPELRGDPDLNATNEGVTLVWLK